MANEANEYLGTEDEYEREKKYDRVCALRKQIRNLRNERDQLKRELGLDPGDND